MRKLLFLAVAAAAVTFVTACPNSVKAQGPGTAYYYTTPTYSYPYGRAYYGYAPAYYGYGYAPAYRYYGQNLPAPNYSYYGGYGYSPGNAAWASWDQWALMHGYNR
jgi:hypothetical protein